MFLLFLIKNILKLNIEYIINWFYKNNEKDIKL